VQNSLSRDLQGVAQIISVDMTTSWFGQAHMEECSCNIAANMNTATIQVAKDGA
jgi:hypothetical protein